MKIFRDVKVKLFRFAKGLYFPLASGSFLLLQLACCKSGLEVLGPSYRKVADWHLKIQSIFS